MAGLTEAQATIRPDPERWSVLDCVEHVTLVEERFLGWLEKAKKLDAPRIDKEKEAGLIDARAGSIGARPGSRGGCAHRPIYDAGRRRSSNSTPTALAAFSSPRIARTSCIPWRPSIRASGP